LLWTAIAVAVDGRASNVVPGIDMQAAVSLAAIVVGADGAIEGTLQNNTERKIGDVKILVEYAWIWSRDVDHGEVDPGWSTTHTLPVELAPGASVPVNIAPLQTLAERDDGHFLISAKVVGYTRYRWMTPRDRQ